MRSKCTYGEDALGALSIYAKFFGAEGEPETSAIWREDGEEHQPADAGEDASAWTIVGRTSEEQPADGDALSGLISQSGCYNYKNCKNGLFTMACLDTINNGLPE
eukprot:4431488-Pyramimonas_sp.AAC.1